MNEPMADSHIVVVDDDPGSLSLVERLLDADGYRRVSCTTDPRRVKDFFTEREPDLVVLDLHMPHVDGFVLLDRLRRLVPLDVFVPFLVLTADANAETRRKALKAGATDFLTKPIDIVEMNLRVTRLLETRRLTVTLAQERASLAAMVAHQTEELTEANRDLQRLMRAKDEFVASVSHELRTPLTAVVGFARELSDHPERFEAGEFVPLARMIADQSSDVAFIIDDLLVAARAEIGRIKVLSERVDLRTEVQAATHALSGRADGIRLPEATAVARGDRLRVRQILRNLLANAVRHGGPTVTVEIVPNGHTVNVRVSDDGPGIPPGDRQRLFEPYFHGQGVSGQPASIGLGLTVSRQLARLMGGDLVYQDAATGSTFRLTLPSARDKPRTD